MRLRLAAALALLASTVIGPATPAHADPEPPVGVSDTKGLYISGHGDGAGLGLSQYGAQGRALKSWHAASILNFYYPGTTLSTTRGGIRVWLHDFSGQTVVKARAGLSIYDAGTRKVYPLPTNLGATEWILSGLRVNSGFQLSYFKPGATPDSNEMHIYRPGGHNLVGYGEFRSSSYTLTVRVRDRFRTYRGAIQRRGGLAINRTSLESYARGVVPAVMPSTWRPEALKAQAIASRTLGAYYVRATTDPSATYDLSDLARYQTYNGLAAETSSTNSAVTATAGQVLTYAGAPDNGGAARTLFSRSNGGYTAGDTSSTPEPYLEQVQQDTYEQYASAPVTWHYARVPWHLRPDLEKLAGNSRYHTDIGSLQSIAVQQRDQNGGDWGGRVLTIRLTGTKGAVDVSGGDFVNAIAVRSTWIQIS